MIRQVLYYFHAPGCGACKAQRRPLDEFKGRVPWVEVVERDVLSTPFPARARWQPTATPTFALIRRPGADPEVLVGAQDAQTLHDWVLGLTPDGVERV